MSKEAAADNGSAGKVTVTAYANRNPPDAWSDAALNPERYAPTIIGPGASAMDSGSAIGKISTVSMLPVELSQASAAARIYTSFYGPLPFDHVALTQQFACNYGQSWPTLVYIPICGFLDSTQQHFLGLSPEDMYWKTVTPHEVAHQWWGQTVGFSCYRDQWMSEGFADASAAICLQKTRPKPDEFRDFWKEQRRSLVDKNAMGFRPIDVGPVTLGFRLSSQKTGWNVYRNLVYPKGAYILHMLRMAMWSPKDGDARFSAAMKEFAATYRLRAATTEDFKATMEKYMTPIMDFDGNHKLDWFFRQYVYGTDLPNYRLESQVVPGNGVIALHLKLTQSNVGENFRNLIPVYLELTDGRIVRLGQIPIVGSTTKEVNTQVQQGDTGVKRVLINYYYDVLSTEN